MELGKDFLDSLDIDTFVKVLMYLDDPCDVVRVGSVSRFWRDFVISNSVCKQLCLMLFPQLSSLVRVVDITDRAGMPAEAGSSRSIEWEHEDREHKIYASFAWGLSSSKMSDCILEAINASSIDFYQAERASIILWSQRIEWDIVHHTGQASGQRNYAVVLDYHRCRHSHHPLRFLPWFFVVRFVWFWLVFCWLFGFSC
ncbi:hypothetical protein Dimus_037736 [Dionaea muscipula]